MKIKNILSTVAFVSLLTACNATTGSITHASNFNQVEPNVKISMPKYFFTDQVNKTCEMKKPTSNSFYSSSLFADYDLTNPDEYKWLEDLKDYKWKADHLKRSNSLNVHFHSLTDRMEHINVALTNSIINGSIETQAKKAIELMVTYAENDVIMDSTTVKEIKNMKRNGTFTKCYKGKGNEKAVCHWHTAQEAARYAGQFTLNANLVKPYMNYKELTIVENYVNAMYKDYIKPWWDHSGAGGNINDPGFYQMGHGAISMLAYAHWKNDKKIAKKTFKSVFKQIDKKIWDQGFIDNNSFRGVRGYWYHGSALNNMLAMVALAEEWNYSVSDKTLNKLTDAVNWMNKDAQEYYTWLNNLEKYNEFNGSKYLKYKNKKVYIGNASWKTNNARPYMKSSATFLDYLSETYTKGTINKESSEYKIFDYKRRNQVSDQELGFNPTCITR